MAFVLGSAIISSIPAILFPSPEVGTRCSTHKRTVEDAKGSSTWCSAVALAYSTVTQKLCIRFKSHQLTFPFHRKTDEAIMAIMECYPCSPALPDREMTVKEFKTWLMKFDRDQNGKLSQEELKRALASLHEWFAWWKARKAMKEVDTNGDRQLDREEIDKFVQYAHQHLRTKIVTASDQRGQ